MKIDSYEVEIDQETLQKFNSIPNRRMGNAPAVWTPMQDKLLLMGWKIKPQKELAQLIGHAVNVCRNRYKFLISQPTKRDSNG